MYLGAAPGDDIHEPELSESAIRASADIYRITPERIQLLQTQSRDLQEISQARRDATLQPADHSDYVYTVSPNDVLHITVWNHPELNNPAGSLRSDLAGHTVRNDGYFFYPYVGQVKAAGRTPNAIRAELAARLDAYLNEPQVDVTVLHYRGKKAYAAGQLKQPGPHAITDTPMHITTLISHSGGLTEEADLRGAVLNRNGVQLSVDLYALYYKGDLSQNLLVQDGDVLNIPERNQGKVFVLGEVLKPQARLLPWGRYSLADALGDSEGLNPVTANAGQVYVLRAVDEGRPEIWHLDARRPDALILADAFELQARDVVFVDPAAVTRWSRVVSQILPTASALVSSHRAFR